MSHDFQLFPESTDGDPAIDADTALIMAYLARELSPVQVAAVEERMAADAAFREAVWPMIEAWCLPGSLSAAEMAPSRPTVLESDGLLSLNTARNNARSIREPTTRRGAMTRIAAVIVLTVMPMIAFAQVVRYVAGHPDAPGHTLAKRITQSIAPAPHTIDDIREGRSLNVPGKQVVPVVDLPPANAKTTRTFGAILGLKQIAEGRLVVNDPVRHQLLRFEPNLATWSLILDSVPGTSKSYGMGEPTWMRVLSSFVGDSSIFGPMLPNDNALVLDEQGKIVRAIELGPGASWVLIDDAYWDPQGRPVSLGDRSVRFYVTRVPGQGTSGGSGLLQGDSIPIVRVVALNRAKGRARSDEPATVEKLGFLYRPVDYLPQPAGLPDHQYPGNGEGRLVPVPGPDGMCWQTPRPTDPPPPKPAPGSDRCFTAAKQVINPLYAVDDWAMLPDGTLALVRGHDYHVDWIFPDGTKAASPKLPFEWKRLTDADKQRLVDSTRAAVDSMDALAEVLQARDKPRYDSVWAAQRASRCGLRCDESAFIREGPSVRLWPYEIAPLSEIADYYPPFRIGAAKADADGNLWILPRTTSPSKQAELVYDVVNPTKGLAQRVRLPLGRSIAGFGKGGVVYLQYGDLKNGFILERSTLASPIPK